MYDRRDRVKVRNAVLAATALAWVLLAWTLGWAGPHTHQHVMTRGGVSPGAAVNWLLMLAAMMAPVLIQPILFVRASSFARRRGRLTLLFVAGYTAVWIVEGALMLLLTAALGSSGSSLYGQATAVLVIALVWQCSPAKQACLNRCHALWELAAFGRAADTAALTFGVTQGVWCVGSCWAWMLLPLLLPSGHLAAMTAVAVLIFCERLDNPAPPSWRQRGLDRTRRIVVGRVRILVKANATG